MRALPFCSLGLGSTLFYLPLRASRRPSSVNAALRSSGLPPTPWRTTLKALDNALQAMANVTELIDDVDEADKRPDSDKYLDRRYRKANAYEALNHLLTTALDKSATLQRRQDDYHKASPELAHWLARWQAEDAKA